MSAGVAAAAAARLVDTELLAGEFAAAAGRDRPSPDDFEAAICRAYEAAGWFESVQAGLEDLAGLPTSEAIDATAARVGAAFGAELTVAATAIWMLAGVLAEQAGGDAEQVLRGVADAFVEEAAG